MIASECQFGPAFGRGEDDYSALVGLRAMFGSSASW